MSRTNIEIDDELVSEVMRRYRVPSKRAAVDLALRRLAGDSLSRSEALELEGSGWEGDLDEMRRAPARVVTLVDSSAWIEYLRATGSETHRAVRRVLERDEPAHTTDVVVMEVLAGARDDDHRDRLRRLLARCEHVPIEGLDDYETAAEIYRACRHAGETVRALTDCLIAVVARRAALTVLHADRDFDVLARHAGVHAERANERRRR